MLFQFRDAPHCAHQHAAGDVLRLEAMLQEDAGGVVGALGGAADDVDPSMLMGMGSKLFAG
jgi:hypothetical protein